MTYGDAIGVVPGLLSVCLSVRPVPPIF